MSRRLGGPCVWFALVGLVVASLHSEPPSQPDAGPPAVQPDASPSTTALVTARLESVERFFATELPTLYGTELAAVGGLQPYDPNDEATLPRCNGSVAGASFYSQNAFFCRE
ncbi:MAG: hypothetical protein KDB21_19730 [Acidimicrobiales bacterium]|nr:hypothetical protein [Acidimicrobiales bacterium]